MLAATTASKQKLVVVLINGGPIAIDEVKGTAAAILVAGLPGQAGGQAIAETLYGANNPSGKLTTTIYPTKYANGEPMSGTPWMDASLRPRAATNLPASEGRTHLFYTGTPVSLGHMRSTKLIQRAQICTGHNLFRPSVACYGVPPLTQLTMFAAQAVQLRLRAQLQQLQPGVGHRRVC